MNAAPESLQSVFDSAFAGIRQAREAFTPQLTPREIGTIASVSTGIARVSGLPGVGFEELVTFPGGVFGIAFNVDEDEIGVVLLGDYAHLHAGDEVGRTGRVMDVAVGGGLLGRIIDPLGRPLDANGPVAAGERLPIERPSSAGDLQSVVRTMKALAASSIGQYERSGRALGEYYRTVELGLGACFRESKPAAWTAERNGATDGAALGAVVFGSDQGLVGQFNDVVAAYAIRTLAALPGQPQVWAVGARVHARLAEAGLPLVGLFTVPNSVKTITPLVGTILVESEARRSQGGLAALHLFYNRPGSGAVYAPVNQRLLPLDETWRRERAELPWPTKNLAEVLGGGAATLRALIREYLFVSLFRACAESLAS
jgi:F-type H+-transporting ATPase subunit gamma